MGTHAEPHGNRYTHAFKPDSLDTDAIFEATPHPYLILNSDFTIIGVNNAYLAATSTSREKIMGWGIFDIFPDNPKDPHATGVKNLRASLERVVKTKKPHRMDIQKYDIPVPGSPDEFREHYWSPINTPVLDEHDELICIIHHVEDVTETVKAKMQAAELEEREARFRQIANSIPQIVWTTLPGGKVNWCNECWYQYTGTPKDIPFIEWQQHVHPEDLIRYSEVRKDSLKREKQFSLEVRLRNFKGEYRWHWSTMRPVKDESGQLIEWVGITTDIHDLNLAKEKIQEDEERFRTITNAVPQIVWSTLPDGYHDYFNDRYYEFTGAPRGTMYGDDWIVFHHPDDRQRLKKVWKHSLVNGELYEIEYRMRHHSGEWRWVLARALPIRNKEGKIIRWFGTCTDIHDQKQTQTALNEAIRDREMFFSIASHELKSPLTALSLQAQLQLKKLKAPNFQSLSKKDFQSMMEKIFKQTEKLVRLVDEMLDLSRITSGKFKIELTSCDLCELLRDSLNRLKPAFQKAGVSIPHLEQCEGSKGNWDPLRIEQVIINLLTNALRYGNGKPINVRLKNFEKVVRLSVQDHGIGISDDAKESIFNRFERATNTSKKQGLGLGLYITKEIVLAHKGRIWVESEAGQGSTFHVDLPRNPQT